MVLAGAALVALLVEPVRRYTRRVTDRLLFRRDTDRLGVMSRLAARASGTATLPVVRTARLADELQGRPTELAESRRRPVEAHDTARRAIERDLHDRAQARLVALRMRIGALLAETGDPRLGELGTEVDAVVRGLRDLARGLHPPLLDEHGVAAALRAATRPLRVPVTVRATGFGRRPRAVEAAVYFSCLEAVHNAVRHASPSRIEVALTGGPDGPAFTVTDDGGGFGPGTAGAGTGLTNITDRVPRSAAGSGSTAAPGRAPGSWAACPVSRRSQTGRPARPVPGGARRRHRSPGRAW